MGDAVTPVNSTDALEPALRQRRQEAEIRKLDLEAREIEQRLKKRWYDASYFVQVTLAACAAAGLLAAWMITYMQPILNRKQEIASLDATIQAKINEQQRQENERRTAALRLENKSLGDHARELSELNDSLRKQQEQSAQLVATFQAQLRAQNAKLTQLASQPTLSVAQRQRLTDFSQQSSAQIDSLEKQVGRLKNDQVVSKEVGKSIASQITAAALRDTTWKGTCEDCKPPPVAFIRLRGDGHFDWSYEGPETFKVNATNTWKVDGQRLILSWNGGFSIETYSFPNPDSRRVDGTKSNDPGAPYHLDRIK